MGIISSTYLTQRENKSLKPTTVFVYQAVHDQHGSGNYGIWEKPAIGKMGGGSLPLAYIQRPRRIKDDKVWDKIIQGIQCSLPSDLEIK